MKHAERTIGEGLGMIWAEATGGVIGRAGTMPWHLPEDLAHFKRTTWGAPVIMGRRTWESLPESFRPLPGRTNVVITSDAAYGADGATVVATLEEALALTKTAVRDAYDAACADNAAAAHGEWPARAAWIMGGGQLYRAAMPLADELVVTRISIDVDDADTFAPEIGPEWHLTESGPEEQSQQGLGYVFERWTRH
ncbi:MULTISPECIES: dihydrofolate reductase [unclassified Leucobacter]|uniref:dihydrofolate reductase n=1 Tax=unclassified Leucobacter TaxID=2621730 RepID=UPI00203A837D|nr:MULTISPECIES: dihydrofolate reductase [unclassified Leucobacter]